MALFKCKMCGGTLELTGGESVATCEYCGTQQTVPTAAEDGLQGLFNRANVLRLKNEFDKAESLYEKILQTDDKQAEAYWGLILCKYGIEYVEDPKTFKRLPTCHRASFDSVIADEDYKSALACADSHQKRLYEEEAREIDRIQKEILALSQKEEPYDVFICYKETDENGKRTQDSVIANDIYYQLTQEGLKVFYAAITLEDKLGSAYEPCIFAALNSAKVMLCVGTKPEHFNAVWVKNEWGRYLKLMKKDRSRTLIPCYKDMDPYELPEEFAHLQAQDMAKIGFISDIVRGIKKLLAVQEPQPTVVKETVVAAAVNGSTAPLLKRVFMFLEDGEWDRADEFCEQVLNIDPECAEAYLGKLMAELNVKTRDELKNCATPFDGNNNYKKALRFGDNQLRVELESCVAFIVERNENARLEGIYKTATDIMNRSETWADYTKAHATFATIPGYKDADALCAICAEKAEEARLTALYNAGVAAMEKTVTEQGFQNLAKQFEEIRAFRDSENMILRCQEKAEQCRIEAENTRKAGIIYQAKKHMQNDNLYKYEEAIRLLQTIPGWGEADELLTKCQRRIDEIKAQQEADRQEAERLAQLEKEEAERRAKRNKRTAIIATVSLVAIILVALLLNNVIIPNIKYGKAVSLMDAGDIVKAYDIFKSLGDYKDSTEKANSIRIAKSKEQLKNAKVGDYIQFGLYEQDNDPSNGQEDIDWLVLDIQDDRALVISKYALDCQPYNTSSESVTWETCSLRKWLDVDFMNVAFTSAEKDLIPRVAVAVNGSITVQDQVFLLTRAEAIKYLGEKHLSCEHTDYAVANGVGVATQNEYQWWLRGVNEKELHIASVVDEAGSVRSGIRINNGRTTVRPAMWIDLSAIS